MIIQNILRVRKTSVVVSELLVVGKYDRGQSLYLLIAAVVELRGIQNPGSSSIAVTEGIDIHKIEMGSARGNQELLSSLLQVLKQGSH